MRARLRAPEGRRKGAAYKPDLRKQFFIPEMRF